MFRFDNLPRFSSTYSTKMTSKKSKYDNQQQQKTYFFMNYYHVSQHRINLLKTNKKLVTTDARSIRYNSKRKCAPNHRQITIVDEIFKRVNFKLGNRPESINHGYPGEHLRISDRPLAKQ